VESCTPAPCLAASKRKADAKMSMIADDAPAAENDRLENEVYGYMYCTARPKSSASGYVLHAHAHCLRLAWLSDRQPG
jgi:hypothetical protein